MTDRPGYQITTATKRALADFRATLPPEDSDLRICPPGCRGDHGVPPEGSASREKV